MNYATASVVEIAKTEGVNDLKPMPARIAFAKALQAEANGAHEAAAAFLNKAVGLAIN